MSLFQTHYIAVMEFTRTPPHLSLRHESPLQRKIRILQEASDKQSIQVRQLLLSEANILSLRSPRKTSLIPFPIDSYHLPKPQTARVRYHYEDFLEEQELKEVQASQRAHRKCGQQVSLRVMQVEGLQSRQLDQQMQYLKSEEYRKYLEGLAQGHSPRKRTPLHDKRPHQFYHKQKNRQMALPVKSYMPAHHRITTNSFYRQSVSPKKVLLRDEARFANFTQRSPSREITKSQINIKALFQNYQPYKPHQTPRDLPREPFIKDTRKSSAEIVQEQESPPTSLHKQIRPQCKNKSQPVVKKQTLRKSPAFVNADKQPVMMKQTRIQTYRKQLQFRNRQQQRPSREKRKKEGRNHKYSYTFKMGHNKQNVVEQAVPSSVSSSAEKSPYKIQFKIDRQTHNKSYHAPTTSTPKKPSANSKASNHGYGHTQKENKTQKKARQVTEAVYFERALQQSQTNSTATRTEHPKRSRKISVISQSKIK